MSAAFEMQSVGHMLAALALINQAPELEGSITCPACAGTLPLAKSREKTPRARRMRDDAELPQLFGVTI